MTIMDRVYRKNLPASPSDDYKELVRDIDSLNNHISSINKINDSLRNAVDTTKVKIIKIREKYEADYIDITNQPLGDDVKFFSDYLSESYGRFFGGDNSSTVEAH
nr:MAG TPA: hypothetical protein [Caudoviricetes sp.]